METQSEPLDPPNDEPVDATTETAPQVISAKLWQSALRFALDHDGAPARCSRRSCRGEGMCGLRWKEGQPLRCGGGISDAALEQAARLALFGTVVAPSA